jgi:hypothetical protein
VKKEDVIETLKNLIMHNSATESDFKEAQRQVKLAQEAHERQRKEKAERGRLERIENNKPKNRYPALFRYKHVEQNLQELLNYCQTYDLSALEVYATELSQGKHRLTFRTDNPYEALQFLRAQIALRKPANNEKIKLLHEIKDGLKENRLAMAETQEQLKQTEKTAETLKNKITDDPAKSYIK